MKIKISKEDEQEAYGLLLQRSLRLKRYYESKSEVELLALLREQYFIHFVDGCVRARDNVELFIVSGLLLEKGFSQKKLEEIKVEIIANNIEDTAR